jgi:hypothetical protein
MLCLENSSLATKDGAYGTTLEFDESEVGEDLKGNICSI